MSRPPPTSTLFPYTTLFRSRTYKTLPLGFEIPKVEAVLIPREEGEVMGAGETAITVVAAAIGNAIFDADRKSTRLNSSHANISYAVFCLKKKKEEKSTEIT